MTSGQDPTSAAAAAVGARGLPGTTPGRFGKIRHWSPLWLLVLGILWFGGARLIQHLPWVLPPCGLRTLTGIPCPFCGSTRALIAWSHLEAMEALRWNPLVALGFVALCTGLLLRYCGWAPGRELSRKILSRLQRRPWPAILLVCGLANWVYLIIWLPK